MKENTLEFTELRKEILTENVNRLYRIVLMVNAYPDRKKILRYIGKIISNERRRLKKMHYPWMDREDIGLWWEDLALAVKALRKAKRIGKYNRAKDSLERLTETLRKALHLDSAMTADLKGVRPTIMLEETSDGQVSHE